MTPGLGHRRIKSGGGCFLLLQQPGIMMYPCQVTQRLTQMSEGKMRTMWIVLDASTPLLILFLSRGRSGTEGCGQSSGASQTDRHALCSVLPQTQGLQRRTGGAAVRRLGWPGLCWKDLTLSLVNMQPHNPYTFPLLHQVLSVSVHVCLCVSSKCFLLPLCVVSHHAYLFTCWSNAVASHSSTVHVYTHSAAHRRQLSFQLAQAYIIAQRR